MRLLPMVGRELRENSRRGGTYWLRVRVAAQAVLIGIGGYVESVLNPAVKLGTVLFWGVAGVSMLFCLLAGRRSTADCISQEKRDGTLGLLFLTDLKGYDVVLGKLAGTSVTALYALLAVFPVLCVPLLIGGMTSGEGERMVVVLTNTFFFSVAIGIFASAVSRDYRTAMGVNFLLWLALVAAPVACGGISAGGWVRPLNPTYLYSCPVFSFIASSDAVYSGRVTGFWATGSSNFWKSIAVTHALSWMLVLAACWIVPRTWGDQPKPSSSRRRWRWRDIWAWLSYGGAAGRKSFRKHALDQNAYFWHAARARLKPIQVWVFVIMSGAWWMFCWAITGSIWLDEITFAATAVLLNLTFKLWITHEAAQRLSEDRRSGAFELLLPTCLTVTDILRGQWLALRRQFLKPLAVLVFVEAGFIALLSWEHKQNVAAITMELLVLLPDIAALILVTMSAAIGGQSQTKATAGAVVRILILPWVAMGIVHWTTASLVWLTLIRHEPSALFEQVEWVIIALGVDLMFGLSAWRSLRHDFRRLATQSPQSVTWRARIGKLIAWSWALARRLVPAGLRIPALATLGVIVALVIFRHTRPARVDFPPPVLVSITQSNAPLRVLPGGHLAVLFLLPDGSLWRWGSLRNLGPGRALMPQPVGTNHDWLKVAAHGLHTVGLRGDGTLWEGEFDDTASFPVKPAIPGSNWVDFAAGPTGDGSIALKKDGTIWSWGRYQPTRTSSVTTNLARIGSSSNWTAVTTQNVAYLGLRSDGTLWIWGNVIGSRNGGFFVQTNVNAPLQLCSDTNWISIDAYGQARNRAGELWDTAGSLPNPNAGAVAVCRQITPDWAADHIESAPSGISCRIRPDGTLWSTALSPGQWNQWYFAAPPATPFRHLGTRTDWIKIWGGSRGTAFGMTADGTVWAWGYDIGRERVVTARMRFQMLEELLNGQAQRAGSLWSGGNSPPILEEPRPLMKIVKAPPP